MNDVHILMPAFNAQSFIANSLASALAQPQAKILVFDDGSTDGTHEIIRAHAAAHPGRIVAEHSASNQGIAHGRQRLISMSQAQDPDAPFLWLDSDDKFTDSRCVEDVTAQMRRTGADICLFGFNVSFENDTQELRDNAKGLMAGKARHEGLLDTIRATDDETVAPASFPQILTAEALGWVKAYAAPFKRIWPRTQPELKFEDFPPMALLLNAGKVTALAPDRPVIDYLRRAGSITGDRKPAHFHVDILEQLKAFENNVDMQNPAKAVPARNFISLKFNQYKDTLQGLIDTRKPGFDEGVMRRYTDRARELNLTP